MNINTEQLQVPFLKNTFISKIQSFKSSDKWVFTSTDILAITEHVNFTDARKDAKLIEKEDYIVLERKSQPEGLWKQLEGLNLVAKRSARITLVYESGFWKMAMNCRTSFGVDLRNWLANIVLPTIRKTGKFQMSIPITQQEILNNTNVIVQIENSKLINDKNFKEGGVERVIKYNVDNCKQVTNQTPVEVKKAYGRPCSSAKQALREINPSAAMTMSLNDYLIVKHNKELEQLKEVDKHFLTAFKTLTDIGIKLQIEE